MRVKNDGRKPQRVGGLINPTGLTRQKSGGPFPIKGRQMSNTGALGSKPDELGRKVGSQYGMPGKSVPYGGDMSNPSSDSDSDSSNSSGKSNGM